MNGVASASGAGLGRSHRAAGSIEWPPPHLFLAPYAPLPPAATGAKIVTAACDFTVPRARESPLVALGFRDGAAAAEAAIEAAAPSLPPGTGFCGDAGFLASLRSLVSDSGPMGINLAITELLVIRLFRWLLKVGGRATRGCGARLWCRAASAGCARPALPRAPPATAAVSPPHAFL